jgi:hypothetical protein
VGKKTNNGRQNTTKNTKDWTTQTTLKRV